LKGRDVPISDKRVVAQKKAIDDALALEEQEGPWSFREIFKSGPLKIRRRYLLAIGKIEPEYRRRSCC
jgi:hypothetical protein